MKKSLFLLLLVCTVSLRANTTVADPDLGNGRLVVCAQNLRNYYVTNTAQLDEVFNGKNGGLDGKTDRIVSAFLHLDADIFAVCEIECMASTVAHLTDALNTAAGTTRYGYVSDPQESSERTQSAFIYRTDKVKPYRDNLAGSNDPYQYSHRNRIQTFEEISTGERFILSMNHFKAKEGDNDNTDANRERNANDLLNKLSVITYDPDALIMGDLNCTISESPLQILLNAGYTEMLLEYNPDAYSHDYSGYELIDHAFANGTLKTQIKGADVYHINTSSKKGDSNWYSDHDPVLVSLSLNANGDHPDNPANPDNPGEGEDCAIHYQADFKEGLGDFTVCTTQGSVSWNSNANYGAVISGYNKTAPMESWLISPAFDLSGADSATIAFRHNIYHDNSNGQYTQLQTLWYTNNYNEAAPASSDWHQLTIPEYGVKKWVDCEVLLPKEALKSGFRYAFKYTAESGSAANYWEVDNTSFNTVCTPVRCAEVDYTKDFKQGLNDFEVTTPQGSVSWNSNANYGAVINGYNKTAPMESWLISPAFDLRGAESATIAFRHNIYYDNSNGQYAKYQTLWYTTDYNEAAPASSTWHQLTIPDYAVKKYINTSVSLPIDAFKEGFRFAFKYTAESSTTANYWEIDNVSLTSTCPTQGQDIPQTGATTEQRQVRKFLRDGVLYIQVGTTTYTLSGYLLR